MGCKVGGVRPGSGANDAGARPPFAVSLHPGGAWWVPRVGEARALGVWVQSASLRGGRVESKGPSPSLGTGLV
jgi:hypothetical protein